MRQQCCVESAKTMERLDGKCALVTGASRGIGKAVAQAYARAGARLVISARGEKDLRRTAHEIESSGGVVRWEVADLTEVRETERVVRSAERHYGALDIVVNSAGILGPRAPIVDYSLSSWEAVLKSNLTAVFLVCKEALSLMIPRRQGSIINVSSGVGRIGKARWGAYAVSKFGVESLTQILAEDMRDKNVRVNAVNPGGTRTAKRALAYTEDDPQSLPTPDEMTGVFLYLASDASTEVTGKSFDARDWLGKSR